MQAIDKKIAGSINKASADKTAEQDKQTSESNPNQTVPIQTVKVKSIFKAVNVRAKPSE
jgi:hypothetical protein